MEEILSLKVRTTFFYNKYYVDFIFCLLDFQGGGVSLKDSGVPSPQLICSRELE